MLSGLRKMANLFRNCSRLLIPYYVRPGRGPVRYGERDASFESDIQRIHCCSDHQHRTNQRRRLIINLLGFIIINRVSLRLFSISLRLVQGYRYFSSYLINRLLLTGTGNIIFHGVNIMETSFNAVMCQQLCIILMHFFFFFFYCVYLLCFFCTAVR